MKIGIDCRLPAYQMGGISQYVLHLLPALAEIDSENQYTILQSRKDEQDHTPVRKNFSQWVSWTPCHHRFEREALSLELASHNLDVWHSIDFIPPRRGGKRHVITVHDLNFLFYPQYLTAESRRYYNDQIEWAVAKADVISADSESTRQDIIEQLGVSPDKVETVLLAANPVYSTEFSRSQIEETVSKYNLPEDFLLFVGTIEPRKNIPVLIEAMNLLETDIPLVLVGRKGWNWEPVFETIQASGLEKKIVHLEGIHDAELAHVYHSATLLLQPSHYEGFGLPPLEAMHCGLPVVSSNRASLPEIVGEAGVLLPPDDLSAWVETISSLLSDEARRAQMREMGYAQASKFKWEETARKTLELYQRVGRAG